jgi:hypothetical protein
MPKMLNKKPQKSTSMTLKQLRVSLGKSREEFLQASKQQGVSWSETIEGPGDHLVSSVRDYVKALGGELEITARIGRKRIKLAV